MSDTACWESGRARARTHTHTHTRTLSRLQLTECGDDLGVVLECTLVPQTHAWHRRYHVTVRLSMSRRPKRSAWLKPKLHYTKLLRMWSTGPVYI